MNPSYSTLGGFSFLLVLTLCHLPITAWPKTPTHASNPNTLPDLYWNTSNPMFHISNTDHIIDVILGSQPAPKINIICPYYPGLEDTGQEQHVIYSVEKEEFDTCRILRPQPRIVAYCTEPKQQKFFTISFRSFSPMPGVLEFLPGKDYYFISTSGPGDLHSRSGGYCVLHNMKVIFKVIQQNEASEEQESDQEEEEEEVEDTEKVMTSDMASMPWTEKQLDQRSEKDTGLNLDLVDTGDQVVTHLVREQIGHQPSSSVSILFAHIPLLFFLSSLI